MSTSVPSPARLASLSTNTLSQILELTRASQLKLPTASLSAAITRNLNQLNKGLNALELAATETDDRMNELTSQYNRLITLSEPLGVVLPHDETKGKSKMGKLVDAGDQTEEFDSEAANGSGGGLEPLAAGDPLTAARNPQAELERLEADEETLIAANRQVEFMQKQMIRDQDETLTSLSSAIQRQHSLSLNISNELELQSGLLDETDSALDRTESNLRRASGRLNQFSQKAKDTGSTGLIVALVVVLIILILVFKI